MNYAIAAFIFCLVAFAVYKLRASFSDPKGAFSAPKETPPIRKGTARDQDDLNDLR